MAVLMENNADPNIQDKEVKIDSMVHKCTHTQFTVELRMSKRFERVFFIYVYTGADCSPLVL